MFRYERIYFDSREVIERRMFGGLSGLVFYFYVNFLEVEVEVIGLVLY